MECWSHSALLHPVFAGCYGRRKPQRKNPVSVVEAPLWYNSLSLPVGDSENSTRCHTFQGPCSGSVPYMKLETYCPSKMYCLIDPLYSSCCLCRHWPQMGDGWRRQTGSGYSLIHAGKVHELTFDLLSVVQTYEGKRETRPRKLYDQPCGPFGYVYTNSWRILHRHCRSNRTVRESEDCGKIHKDKETLKLFSRTNVKTNHTYKQDGWMWFPLALCFFLSLFVTTDFKDKAVRQHKVQKK